jgi:hypothetical protein
MTDDTDELAALLEHAAAELRQRPPQIGDVIDQILRGELLTLDQAGDVAGCSDEKLRKQCVLTAATSRPLGIKIADRWFVSKHVCSMILSRARSIGAVARMSGGAPRNGRRSTRAGRDRRSRWWRRCRRMRRELFGRHAPESRPIMLILSLVVRDPLRTFNEIEAAAD